MGRVGPPVSGCCEIGRELCGGVHGSGLSCLQDRWNVLMGNHLASKIGNPHDEGSVIVSHVPHAISTVSYIFEISMQNNPATYRIQIKLQLHPDITSSNFAFDHWQSTVLVYTV